MASFRQGRFSGCKSLLEDGQRLYGPVVPLVTFAQESDLRTCIYDVINSRSLHEWRGREARFLPCRPRSWPIHQRFWARGFFWQSLYGPASWLWSTRACQKLWCVQVIWQARSAHVPRKKTAQHEVGRSARSAPVWKGRKAGAPEGGSAVAQSAMAGRGPECRIAGRCGASWPDGRIAEARCRFATRWPEARTTGCSLLTTRYFSHLCSF
jgi:hypothetical protein